MGLSEFSGTWVLCDGCVLKSTSVFCRIILFEIGFLVFPWKNETIMVCQSIIFSRPYPQHPAHFHRSTSCLLRNMPTSPNLCEKHYNTILANLCSKPPHASWMLKTFMIRNLEMCMTASERVTILLQMHSTGVQWHAKLKSSLFVMFTLSVKITVSLCSGHTSSLLFQSSTGKHSRRTARQTRN